MSTLDGEYMLAARKAEADALERGSRRGGATFVYDNLQWFGLEPQKTKIFRFVGKPTFIQLSNPKPRDSWDPKTITLSFIADDKGKFRYMILPEDTDNSLIWRVINRVFEKKWVNTPNDPDGKKGYWDFFNKAKHNELFSLFERSGLPASDNRVKLGLEGYGWEGKEMFIANIIDREHMAWHKENKHTALLSRNINVRKNDDGTEDLFIDKGVPAYGIIGALTHLIGDEDDWKNYDISIERTGKTNPAYIVEAASRYPKKVREEALRGLIGADGPMTEEEMSWEKYNIDKYFGPSSYQKWEKLFIKTFEKVDATFGTEYAKELRYLSEKEKSEGVIDEDNEGSTTSAPRAVVEQAPAVSTRRVVTPEPVEVSSSSDDRELLPTWAKLKTSEKEYFSSVKKNGDKFIISYVGNPNTESCPRCETPAPIFFARCPVCDAEFDDSIPF